MLLATWFSALGTVGAVIVALWLAKNQHRPSLLVRATFGSIVVMGQKGPTPDYFSIRVVNRGPRDVVISGVQWRIGWLKRQHFIQFPPDSPLTPRLPHRMSPGDSANFLFPKEDFERNSANLQEAVRELSVAGIKPPVRVGVYVSTGEEALVKPDDSVMTHLLARAV